MFSVVGTVLSLESLVLMLTWRGRKLPSPRPRFLDAVSYRHVIGCHRLPGVPRKADRQDGVFGLDPVEERDFRLRRDHR